MSVSEKVENLYLHAQGQPHKAPRHLSSSQTPRDDTTGKFLCCVCKSIPTHSRMYYGRVFCTECFHKYIWTPTNNAGKVVCSGDAHAQPAPISGGEQLKADQ